MAADWTSSAALISCMLGGRRPVVDCAGVANPDAEALIEMAAPKGLTPAANLAAARAFASCRGHKEVRRGLAASEPKA